MLNRIAELLKNLMKSICWLNRLRSSLYTVSVFLLYHNVTIVGHKIVRLGNGDATGISDRKICSTNAIQFKRRG